IVIDLLEATGADRSAARAALPPEPAAAEPSEAPRSQDLDAAPSEDPAPGPAEPQAPEPGSQDPGTRRPRGCRGGSAEPGRRAGRPWSRHGPRLRGAAEALEVGLRARGYRPRPLKT